MVSVSPEFPRFNFQDILLHIKDLIDYSLGGDISELEVCVCVCVHVSNSETLFIPPSTQKCGPPKTVDSLHWNLLP